MDFNTLTEKETLNYISNEYKVTNEHLNNLLNENVILYPLVEGISAFKVDGRNLSSYGRISKKENIITIEVINNKDKTILLKYLKNNALLNNSVLYGISISYDNNENITLTWPIITLDRKKKAAEKIKHICDQVIEYARTIRQELRKSASKIGDKGRKNRVEQDIDKEFIHCKDNIKKRIELAIVKIEKI